MSLEKFVKKIQPYKGEDLLCLGAFLILLSLCSYLIVVAISLRVDLFDSYGLFLNARQILYGYEFPYYPRGTPALSLLYAFFWGIEGLFSFSGWGIAAARVSAVLFFFCLIVAAYRFFRKEQSAASACFGAILLSLNPLLIHYAPFPKEDLPGVFFLTMTFYDYLKWRDTPRRALLFWAILWAALAGVTRHNLFVVIPGVILLYEWGRTWGGAGLSSGVLFRRLLKLAFCFILLAPLASLIFPWVAYGVAGRGPWWIAPALFFKDISSHYGFLAAYKETPFEAYAFLVQSCGWPAVILAILGMVTALGRKKTLGGFCFVWFWAIFLLQGHILQHREARFFFPAYVPFYFFVAAGFWELLRWRLFFRGRHPRGLKIAWVLTGALLLAFSAKTALGECLKFQDSFYRRPFAQEIGECAARWAGPHRILWVGGYYPYHPKDYFFHAEDEATYLYHLYEHTLRFFLKREILVVKLKDAFSLPEGAPVFMKGLAPYLEDQDVLVVHKENKITTRDVPEKLGPVFVQRVRKQGFRRMASQGPCVLFGAPGISPASGFAACQEGERLLLKGWGLPDQYLEVFLFAGEKKVIYNDHIFKPEEGMLQWKMTGSKGVALSTVREIGILFYDEVRTFSPEISSSSIKQ